jgi:hypothetical protein
VNDDNLDALLTALYVKIDDELEVHRWMGRPPRLSDSELICLAVAQALLGFGSETRWLRYANTHLLSMFPYLPQQSGYNKRLKAALPLVKKAIRMLAVDTDFWFDNHWIADSTPVPCGMSRPTVKRSAMAGWTGYGYCASHSRFFWGLRLYLVCTPAGMPILWALANPKMDERGEYGPYPERLRQQFEGVIWRFKTGGQWREMPQEFGAWSTVHNRFRQWRDAGVFEALLEGLIAEAANDLGGN